MKRIEATWTFKKPDRHAFLLKRFFAFLHVLGLAALLIGCPPPEGNPSVNSVSLPQTGQTTSYATGDDGALEKGIAWPAARFTDNGDGTITDNLTGLMWDQTGNRFFVAWTNAFSGVSGLAVGGYSDWRVPNRSELLSLINHEETDTAAWLNARGFNNMIAGRYWSSTSYASDTAFAWSIDLNDYEFIGTGKTGSCRVLAVRGTSIGGSVRLPKTGQATGIASRDDGNLREGVAWPGPRFTDNGNGTVTDRLTNLVWLQDGDRMGTATWAQALSDCGSLADNGADLTDGSAAGDWRLPNYLEIYSLMHAGETNVATWLNSEGFTDIRTNGNYWTSTTDPNDTAAAWRINMGSGSYMALAKTSSLYIMPVRDVQ